MVANDNIISFGSSHKEHMPKLNSAHQSAVKECRLLVVNSLPKCFSFFDSLDDTLFDHADKADSNKKQDEFFVAMRQLRVVQGDIKKQFSQLILDDFDALWSSTHTKHAHPKLESTSETDSELSLLQNADLEEDIAIKRIASKGQANFGNELGQLSDRFSHMLDIDSVIAIDNPLSPDSIIKHLKYVISPLPVSISIKLVIYKQFELQAVAELGRLYQKLNEKLINNGILPNNGYKVKKNPQSSSAQQTTSAPTPPDHLNSNDGNNNIGQNQVEADIFNELRHLLHRAETTGTSSGQYVQHAQGPTTANTADIASVLSALSNIQQTSGQISYSDSGNFQLPEIRTSLLQTLNQSQSGGTDLNHAISHLDNDTIDVIDLLFEFILEDNTIPAPMRALLARLQIPMIKVAIADKAFFSKKNHPARRLLNNLAKAVTGWDKNNSQNALQKQVESTVNTILTQFDTNIEIFDDLNSQLEQFINNQEQTSQALAQRTAQTKQGQEELDMSQQEVDSIINQSLAEYSPIPTVAVTLIEDGWKHVLRLKLLQKGKDSNEWNEAVALMQTLIWSVTPKSEASDRKQLLESIPNLLRSLRLGLSGASFNQHKMTELFKSLQECHIKCLSGNAFPTDELQNIEAIADTSPTIEQESIDPIPEEQIVLPEESALERAKNLKIGTWLEVTDEDSSRRIKFSWRSNLTGHCLFVTYQGLKAAELSLSELARWFQKGQAIVLDQSTPLMDRALQSMMNTVNKTK
ncbi:MAG: hypothetical protein DRQ35_00865 [Gammaproteobacteria bacterium]|nr:MAG: hypothetical protein DRQ35_00865 [Gammaproteobacteria bacterium]